MAPRSTTRPAVPTLATVAAAAGVSPATASRVINGSARVSDGHRAAVEAAVARLGYVPNRAARSLATRRTGALALVVREPVSFGVSDPYLSTCVIAASQALVGTGSHLVVMVGRDEEEAAAVGDFVRSGHVDGVLLLSVHRGDPLPAQLQAVGVPLVLGGRPPDPLPGAAYVDVDNLGGGASAARHLLERGRRVVAALAGPADMPAAADRLRGFRTALREEGRDTGLVAYAPFTRAGGERAVRELLEAEPAIDAVFAGSDVMAAGALRALADAGRRVPDDVAVVGFDDVELARYTAPALTTVRQPTGEQVRLLVEALLAQVEGRATAEPVVLPTELVVRSSS
ncbi:LacI family transcriptional regulator [Motilibacter rhizosphaerae]|uniref:LacI family transcriptional regulator n=1 Tax=Motilibacter rhizosphaerae TaxID=598652 RepID=A0A4Q7NVC3_9ACTN|nr:LacI family DNA-binding transcriptional regulator [Motilibacter rhizosphaerae]RZS91206.1 LacI family transcriptional regulator [Motilibacter rhizosphaerae]